MNVEQRRNNLTKGLVAVVTSPSFFERKKVTTLNYSSNPVCSLLNILAGLLHISSRRIVDNTSQVSDSRSSLRGEERTALENNQKSMLCLPLTTWWLNEGLPFNFY